jgi:hypothetical protein
MGFEGRGAPRLTSSQRKKILLELRSQIKQLTAKLESCTDDKIKRKIASDRSRLQRAEETLGQKYWKHFAGRQKVAPLPKTYIARRNQEREAFAHISGRKSIRAHFVQGGAPGSKK